jgi:hypothetical protein
VYFQKVLKGIPLPDSSLADRMFESGIQCLWWLRVHQITPQEIAEKLTERNLDWHLNHYADVDPTTGRPFYADTPFISATAGTVERDAFLRRNILFDPLLTALEFATHGFTTTGYVFYAYVLTLGRKALPFDAFAEEVRELNIYTSFSPYHPEGEITAKIIIPGVMIERWEEYDGPAAEAELNAGRFPAPRSQAVNPTYRPPEEYCNVRGTLLL